MNKLLFWYLKACKKLMRFPSHFQGCNSHIWETSPTQLLFLFCPFIDEKGGHIRATANNFFWLYGQHSKFGQYTYNTLSKGQCGTWPASWVSDVARNCQALCLLGTVYVAATALHMGSPLGQGAIHCMRLPSYPWRRREIYGMVLCS